jgi:hypothetical protein
MMQRVNDLLQQRRRVKLRGRGYVVDLAIVHADPTHMQKFFQNLDGTGLKVRERRRKTGCQSVLICGEVQAFGDYL